MPTYVYALVAEQCDRCPGRFEVVQRIEDAKLAFCPDCGRACERQICAVALGGKYSTSDAAAKSAGMTKYRKSGDGVYERVVGSGGPEHLFR